MKNSILRRGIAASLAVIMGVGLCACGDNSSDKQEGKKHYFNVSYAENLPDNLANIGTAVFHGDNLYYTAYDDEDYLSSGVYSYNLLDGTQTTIWESEQEYNEDDVMLRSSSIDSFSLDNEGNLYASVSTSEIDEESLNKDFSGATLDDVLAYMVDMWGYSENDAAQEWEDYYKQDYTDEDGNTDYERFLREFTLTYDYSYAIQKIDADGNVVYSIAQEEESDGYTTGCYDIDVDGKGNLYRCMNKWNEDGTEDIYYVEIFDSEGNKKGEVELDDYATSLFALADGRVGSVGWGDAGSVLSIVDPDSLSITDTYELLSENISPYKDNTVLVNENTTLYMYNLEDQSKEAYVSWMDCNISSNSISSYGMLSDGTLAVLIQNWNSSGASTEIAILTEVDESEVVQTTEIKLACMGLDSDIEQKILEFNKKHDDCHISVTDYYDDSSEEDWDALLNSFTTAVANDPDIDIVIFNDYSQVSNFVSKGLMADLYPFIDSDAELSRDDFMPNVLTACEFDGKLAVLPKSFTVSTVVGKTEDVGPTPGWTLSDMKNLLASKPEGTQLFYWMTRDQALQACLNLGYRDFIDPTNSTCNFDSQEFVDVLEFANMFPEEVDYNEDVDESVLINNGEILLEQYWLSDFEQIQMYEVVFGGDLTYIGYPTSEGNGAMLSLNNIYGITNNCESPELAWEFLREFYLPSDSDEDDMYGSYGFSVRKDDFEKYCEDAMKVEADDSYSWGWGEFEITVQAATQKQVDAVKDLVYNTTAVDGAVSTDITNLILEEAAYYFSGEQTAEDVAAKIQSRMEIYLSETK